MAIRARFSQDLSVLQQRLLRLAEIVDRAIIAASWALSHHSVQEAVDVIQGDQAIDELADLIEREALALLACQQPMAIDLRTITGSMILAAELERIGDYARGIAVIVQRSANLPQQEIPACLGQMAHKARDMLQEAIRAVIQRDATVAQRLRDTDDVVDQLYQQLVNDMLTAMSAQPEHSELITYMLWIGHNLERIADRAVNVAERAAFIAGGTTRSARPVALPPRARQERAS